MNQTKTVNIDFGAVHCNPRHLKTVGRGWARRLRELGGSDAEADALQTRLRDGMAAIIELARIKELAGLTEDQR